MVCAIGGIFQQFHDMNGVSVMLTHYKLVTLVLPVAHGGPSGAVGLNTAKSVCIGLESPLSSDGPDTQGRTSGTDTASTDKPHSSLC